MLVIKKEDTIHTATVLVSEQTDMQVDLRWPSAIYPQSLNVSSYRLSASLCKAAAGIHALPGLPALTDILQ